MKNAVIALFLMIMSLFPVYRYFTVSYHVSYDAKYVLPFKRHLAFKYHFAVMMPSIKTVFSHFYHFTYVL